MIRVAFAALLVFLTACGDSEPAEVPAPEPAASAEPVAAPPATPKPSSMSASHILIAFEGAARSEATRSKEDALALANKLIKDIGGGAEFEALAKEHSDGPSGPRGGSLGSFRPGMMVPPFEAAVVAVGEGDLVKEPVETKFGYHVIRRDAPPPTYGASHILIQYKGSQRATAEITRTKEEAQAHAQGLLDKALGGEDFAALATEHSNGPSAPRGGNLGDFQGGQMVPAFEKGMLEVEPGKVVPHLVETPFGFHVILRQK